MDREIQQVSEWAGSEGDSVEKLKRDPRYQRVQKELAQNRQKRLEDDDRAKRFNIPHLEDKVDIKAHFKWNKDSVGHYQMEADTNSPVMTLKSLAKTGRIVHLLGYKIDLAERVEFLKERYQQLIVESRSHNFLLAKFYEMKYGALQLVLAALGVSSEEIQKLQKDALEGAVGDNIRQFTENEYNAELLGIFSMGKRDNARQRILNEVRSQLMIQMKRLGKPEYYSKEKILQIKQDQIQKIQQDLLEEKQNLEYMREFQT